jgi:hypothetical protein
MAATAFQRAVCGAIAENRRASGESYVAEGLALNTLLGTGRRSNDIDLFHDRQEAVLAGYQEDRQTLERAGYRVQERSVLPSFVEAVVTSGAGETILQWTADSAFRFFPLVEHEQFGLTLHPFDSATNKTLALVGRLVTRDWIDLLSCHQRLQPLGYLAWAASGKDPGFSPKRILEYAGRSHRYTQKELDTLEFDEAPPRAAELSDVWHTALRAAHAVVDLLPAVNVGACVLDEQGNLLQAGPDELSSILNASRVRFHEGTLRGAYPQLVEATPGPTDAKPG